MKKLVLVLLVIMLMVLSACSCQRQETTQTVGASASAGTGLASSDKGKFLMYEEPNYGVKIAYPVDYEYAVDGGDIIFRGADDLYYILQVLLTKKTGGELETYDDVKSMYMEQLKPYWGVISAGGSSSSGFERKEKIETFGVKYVADDVEYMNTYAVGTDGDYFYVVQFVSPYANYQAEYSLREKIMYYMSWGSEKVVEVKETTKTTSVMPKDYELEIEGETGTLSGERTRYSNIGESARGGEAYLGDGGATATYNFKSAHEGNMYLYVALSDDGVHDSGKRNAIINFNGAELKYTHISENTITSASPWKWYYLGEVPVKLNNVVSFEKETTTSAAYVMDKFKLTATKS